MTQPLVSIIIPLFNREKTIQRAIDSVLNQTYPNIEIIVVDDGSTDNSALIVERYLNDARVKLFKSKVNKGANAARNRGIQESKGEYIAFQDSDDEWMPLKLEKQIAYMKEKGFLASFCSFRRFFGDDSQVIPEATIILEGDLLRNKLRQDNVVGTPTLVIHKSIIEEVGIFDESMPRLQDYEYVIRINKRFDFGYINEALVNEYQLTDCISLKQDKLLEAWLLLLKKHSDYIDVDTIWSKYLSLSNIITANEIDWKKYEAISDSIVEGNNFCSKEQLLKSTINIINLQYSKIYIYEKTRYELFVQTLHNKRFVIYGAGFFGRELYYQLKELQIIPDSFIVTNSTETSCIDDIEIKSIAEFDDTSVSVIIAVQGYSQIDIMKELNKKGIQDYYIYPPCL